MKQVARIPLRQVTLSDSRPTVPETVNALASSMADIGLMQPVTVRQQAAGFAVVAGNHRVSAARALGWEEIDAFVLTGANSIEQELHEIDENLIRAPLTPAQRAYAISRRKRLWEALHGEEEEAEETGGKTFPSSLSDGRQAGPQHERQFAADTAERTGQDKRSINMHAARGDALGELLHEIAGTSLDKGVELDALKALPETTRATLIERAKAGERVSARVELRRLQVRQASQAGGESQPSEPAELPSRHEFICPNCQAAATTVRDSEMTTAHYKERYRYCPGCGTRFKTGEGVVSVQLLGANPNPELFSLLTEQARRELKQLAENA